MGDHERTGRGSSPDNTEGSGKRGGGLGSLSPPGLLSWVNAPNRPTVANPAQEAVKW